MRKSYSWNSYLSACEKMCPENLSFPVLTISVPFFQAFEKKVDPARLMGEIETLAALDWLTIEQRQNRIREIIFSEGV